jgi:hypothetical protein
MQTQDQKVRKLIEAQRRSGELWVALLVTIVVCLLL